MVALRAKSARRCLRSHRREKALSCGEIVVSFVLEDSMLPNAVSDGFFQFCRLEQRVSERNAENSLVRLEDSFRHPHVNIFASLKVQPQSPKHDRNESSCSSSDNEVEVVAWLRYFVPFGSHPMNLDIGSVHEFLEENEHRVAADTTAICRPSVDSWEMYGDLKMPGCSPRESILNGGPLVVSARRGKLVLFMWACSLVARRRISHLFERIQLHVYRQWHSCEPSCQSSDRA